MTESHKPEKHSSQEIDELFASEDDAEKGEMGCFYCVVTVATVVGSLIGTVLGSYLLRWFASVG